MTHRTANEKNRKKKKPKQTGTREKDGGGLELKIEGGDCHQKKKKKAGEGGGKEEEERYTRATEKGKGTEEA